MKFSKWIASCFGIGFIPKGSGTAAAAVLCLLWYLAGMQSWFAQLLVIVILFFVGVAVANVVEKDWGEDSSKVVIDEWLGMAVALWLLPINWVNILIAFILFRFFDIAKPLGIRKLEQLPKGWGVMADDLLAGIYANACTWLILYVVKLYVNK